jgi:bla regulator protein blaR1
MPGRTRPILTAVLLSVASLSGLLGGRGVQDRTGLTGRYDWDLTFDPRPLSAAPNAPSPTGPPLLAAIEPQLGLKVESAKGTAEFLVIDSVEAPTPD